MENDSQSTKMAVCFSCGERNEKGTQFCVHCGNPLPIRRKTWVKNRYILSGAIGVISTVMLVFFWMGGFERKLVGRVNGEGITRSEFSKRVDLAKKFYENRYGPNLFEGETGKENLNRIKTDIFDEMVVETILLQEAKSTGYTSAPEEEIEKQVKAIKMRGGLSDADFEKMLGARIEDLKRELRNGWIIAQFIEKAVLKGNQTNAEQVFGQWLAQAKAKVKIETYEKLEPVSTAKASCCKSGCGGGRAQPLDPKIEQEARAKALEYYEKKTQKKGANAKVTNFGCHIQVDIIEGGKIVASLTYNQGEVREI